MLLVKSHHITENLLKKGNRTIMNIQKLKDQLFMFKFGSFIADAPKVFSTGVEINPVVFQICLQWK